MAWGPPKKCQPSKALPLMRQLRQARIAQRMSQHELAYRIGASQSQLSSWEMGHKVPIFVNLVAWAQALGLQLTVEPVSELPDVRSPAQAKEPAQHPAGARAAADHPAP